MGDWSEEAGAPEPRAGRGLVDTAIDPERSLSALATGTRLGAVARSRGRWPQVDLIAGSALLTVPSVEDLEQAAPGS